MKTTKKKVKPANPEYAKHALRFANEIREELELPPRPRLAKGECGDPSACPIARTITFKKPGLVTASVDGDTARVERWGGNYKYVHRDLPRSVKRFISAFDNRRYPSLIGK
jgi:hypothetical protein